MESRQKKSKVTIAILGVIMIILIFLLAAFLYFKNNQKSKVVEPIRTATEEKKETKKEMSASLFMVGDALIHSTIYMDAKTTDGSYDFKPMLEKIKPIASKYDLEYYNQETVLGGVELGLSNYPRFNSPYEVGDAFIDSGFNLVSLATNHTMDKGEQGVLNSLSYWSKQPNVLTAGSYTSFEDRDKKVIKEINGIKYAFFSYTTWTNGLETPTGKEYLNNVYSEELAKNDIERVKDEVDVIIVAMHWGTEYSKGISDSQVEIANYLSNLGVDIIIGSHPHVVEPIEFIGKTMVIYSLGNFISDQIGVERLTGLMVNVNIHKTVEKDNTTISLENPEAELIYTYSAANPRKRNFLVYPYSELNDDILPGYKEYYNTYKNVVLSKTDKVKMKDI